MPKAKSKVQKPKTKDADSAAKAPQVKTRQIAQPKYKSFRISKRIRHAKSLPSGFHLFRRSTQQLLDNWRLFGGIILIYLILNILLVKGLGVDSSIDSFKTALEQVFQGDSGRFLTSFTLFSVLLSNTGSAPTEIAGAYQTMVLVICSLAFIWALRQTQASGKVKARVRDAFYNGMFPLVPFLMVLFVVALQLMPMLTAGFLYATVIGGGIAASALEQMLWYVLLSALIILSLYMVSSSMFALYIVTLPDFTPLKALRTARLRVLHRRMMVLRRVLFLPVALMIIATIVVIPVIMLSAVVAEWLFYVLSVATLAVVHSYMYNLYRELIRE